MRNALVAAVPALVIAETWMRLERPERDGTRLLLVVALALLPALVPRLRARVAALALCALAAVSLAVRAAPWDARPFDSRHDFFGLLLSRLGNGVLDFYDVRLPFDPFFHPEMHAVLLVAAFGFAAALGLAAAARRPLASVLVLLVGAGWPATLLSNERDLARGALILGCALLLLGGLRDDARRVLTRAALAGGVLVLAALAASTQPAVAKSGFLDWEHWDPYTRPDRAVGVRYVWDAQYGGFRFPRKVTTVLKVKAPKRSVYWRATTLDEFTGSRWVERLRSITPELFDGKNSIISSDPLAPTAAYDSTRWKHSEFEVEALADNHVPAPSSPVAYGLDFHSAQFAHNGAVIVGAWLHRGDHYDVWSYLPDPSPAALARSQPLYPKEVEPYLEIADGVTAPRFAAPERAARMQTVLSYRPLARYFATYRPLYAQAQELAADAPSPYAAAVALETWFRESGGFTYDQHPATRGAAPLVTFVTRSKRGYCQHFAGAMALMLRYLGIPARVAEGFTSGKYDAKSTTWTVTDHDAHAWVEVWFRGYGWLPFDPTPGRGSLGAAYSISSPEFNASAAAALLVGAARRILDQYDKKQNSNFGEREISGAGFSVADTHRRHRSAANGAAHRGGSLGKLLLLLAALVVLAIAGAKALRRRARYATSDPRRLAWACRGELVDFLADQGVRIAPSAAPDELMLTLRERLEVDAKPFAGALSRARYGPPGGARSAAERARLELRELQAQVRSRVGLWRRVRGLVSLRSLGFAG
jgi:transglutaminase-like putative cysteine protease